MTNKFEAPATDGWHPLDMHFHKIDGVSVVSMLGGSTVIPKPQALELARRILDNMKEPEQETPNRVLFDTKTVEYSNIISIEGCRHHIVIKPAVDDWAAFASKTYQFARGGFIYAGCTPVNLIKVAEGRWEIEFKPGFVHQASEQDVVL